MPASRISTLPRAPPVSIAIGTASIQNRLDVAHLRDRQSPDKGPTADGYQLDLTLHDDLEMLFQITR